MVLYGTGHVIKPLKYDALSSAKPNVLKHGGTEARKFQRLLDQPDALALGKAVEPQLCIAFSNASCAANFAECKPAVLILTVDC